MLAINRVCFRFVPFCVVALTLFGGERAACGQDAQRRDLQKAERLRAYLGAEFSDQVTQVSVGATQIRIQGKLQIGFAKATLAEVPLWEDATDLKSLLTSLPIRADGKGRFVCAINRFAEDGRDRLLSAWAVARQDGERYVLLSALHYADSEKARANLPAARPRSRKGLGGFPFTSNYTDLEDLGVASGTMNILLNDIIASTPGPGRSPFSYGGRTWYMEDQVVADYDRNFQAVAKRGLMMSVIILLQPVGAAPLGSWIRDAAHPDADPGGLYVMPNFTTRAGVEAYAAAMNFVAERYSRPDGKYGRIHHYILHNEINTGFYWTNAGAKNIVTYLDLYQKSMRLTHLIARQYDPHAKPLISLDHSWTAMPDPRSYPARDLLELLVKFSRVEGDYDWGIAFHPYAQDLVNPRTWQDSEAVFNFKTPYITFKNLEVLDAWARQPTVAFHGKAPREIQLTEQGLNSPDYSGKSLNEQAAGLAYAWKKIEPLKTITAFQYHLWADEPSEGGLRLGLRKFASDPKDPLGKKPAWYLFQSIGAANWDRASAFALPILGIYHWKEVPYTGKIR